MDGYYNVIIIFVLCVFLWYFSNHKYFSTSKLIKKTRNDVDSCVRDVDDLKTDIDELKNVIINIDKKITQIEDKIKNI